MNTFSTPQNSSPPRIPATIRHVASRLIQVPSFLELAKFYYDSSAKYCANRLARCAEVSEVHLVGGMIREWTPVVSDIDLLLVLNQGSENLKGLRKTYLNLRRLVPILGEIQVVSSALWNLKHRIPGPLHWFERSRRFTENGWAATAKNRVYPASYGARFAYAFDRYCNAWSTLVEFDPREKEQFHYRTALRDLKKVAEIQWHDCTPCNQRRTLCSTLVDAYLKMNELAQAANAERLPSPQLTIVSVDAGVATNRQTAPWPNLKIWSDWPLEKSQLELKLHRFYRNLHQNRNRPNPSLLTIPVSPAMYEALTSGWHPMRLQQQLWKNENQNRTKLRAVYFYRLQELLMTNLHLIRGACIGSPLNDHRLFTLDLCANAMMLTSRLVSADRALIEETSQATLPLTTALSRHLKKAFDFSFENPQDVYRVLPMITEIENFLYEFTQQESLQHV